MKKLEDFKEEIHRCSKCGICQHACPVYQELGNDCAVSRGQFIMLDGVIKGDLKLNKNINKYLDLCLKCNKCKSACPTGIDVVQIILSAKYEYLKNTFWGKLENALYSFLESKFVFDNFLNFAGMISRLFRPKKNQKKLECSRAKAVYWGGCVEKFRPDVRDYVIELLNKMNIEVIDVDLGCCGMPFLSIGNLDRFEEQKQENLKKLEELEYDFIVTDCASCEYVLDELYTNGQLRKSGKLKSVYELIAESDLEFVAKKPVAITYHKPCHEKHFEEIKQVFEKCKNIEYKEMNDYDSCCGLAGLEHLSTIKTVSRIIKKKGQNILDVGADILTTSCVGCLVATKISTLFKQKTKRLVTFLKEECRCK